MEEVDRTLKVNLRAPIAMAHALVPEMAARGSGHLLFMSSLVRQVRHRDTRSTTPPSSVCAASPRRCGRSARASGVGVSAVYPGFIREAGMFATPESSSPPASAHPAPRTSPARSQAIERNRAEVDVAPLTLRAGAAFAGLAPGLAATVARKTG